MTRLAEYDKLVADAIKTHCQVQGKSPQELARRIADGIHRQMQGPGFASLPERLAVSARIANFTNGKEQLAPELQVLIADQLGFQSTDDMIAAARGQDEIYSLAPQIISHFRKEAGIGVEAINLRGVSRKVYAAFEQGRESLTRAQLDTAARRVGKASFQDAVTEYFEINGRLAPVNGNGSRMESARKKPQGSGRFTAGDYVVAGPGAREV
jgi:hypothetical protein